MDLHAVIRHPAQGETVRSNRFFIAFGTVCGARDRLQCVLKDGDKVVAEGCMLDCPPDPHYWAARFDTGPLGRGPYTLEVLDGTSCERLDYSPDIRFESSPNYGSFITWPPSPGSVWPNFTAYGTTDRTGISGKMIKDAVTKDGQPNQSGNNWWIYFMNVPKGSGWTLEVHDDQSQPADTHENITVN
jgi:hypothetical protein